MLDYALIIVRYVVAGFGAILVAKGWIKSEDVATLADPTANIMLGGAVWAVPVLWGLWRNRLKPRLKALIASHHIVEVKISPELATKVLADPKLDVAKSEAPLTDELQALKLPK